jgi:hypothetical protein
LDLYEHIASKFESHDETEARRKRKDIINILRDITFDKFTNNVSEEKNYLAKVYYISYSHPGQG